MAVFLDGLTEKCAIILGAFMHSLWSFVVSDQLCFVRRKTWRGCNRSHW